MQLSPLFVSRFVRRVQTPRQGGRLLDPAVKPRDVGSSLNLLTVALGPCLIMFSCWLSVNDALASSYSINVYLKLKPENEVFSLVSDFNQFLAKKKILSAYHLTPFLKHHPLHITLYLTAYKKERVNELLRRVERIAKEQPPITLTTQQFIASERGYVMLAIRKYPALQRLSNEVLEQLAPLRDSNAPIPAWAAHDARRKQRFANYGSPNVLEGFNPHFSILDPKQIQQSKTLYHELLKLIPQFERTHLVTVTTQTDAIGVGIADKQGQIIQELRSFDLT